MTAALAYSNMFDKRTAGIIACGTADCSSSTSLNAKRLYKSLCSPYLRPCRKPGPLQRGEEKVTAAKTTSTYKDHVETPVFSVVLHHEILH